MVAMLMRCAPCLQTLRCADLYSGCGGLSFVDTKTDKVNIVTRWAVDYCESMTLSFASNYQETEVLPTLPMNAFLVILTQVL